APATPGPAPLQFSLTDREGSAAALQEYLHNGLARLPQELARYEAQTVAELALLVGAGDALHIARTAALGASDETQLAALDHFVSRGIQVDTNAVTESVTQADELLKLSPEDNPEYVAARGNYHAITAQRRARLHGLDNQIQAAHNAGDDISGLVEARKRVYDETDALQTEAYEKFQAVHKQFYADRAEKHRELLEQHGRPILDKLLAASPVSQEQADAWAAEQVIDANAKAKL
ncbi:UNVERIFIED_CONTAM: hypothetical protein OHV15_18555, partial [Microbacterium sp. SLM126]